jgi:ethanolamine utilization protein EutP (predicted NTPase)
MATLLPIQMVKGKSMAYARLLRLCKALPETYVVRQQMNPGEGADLLVICGARAVHLLVFDLQPQEIESFRQSSLFGEAPERLAQLHTRWERGPEPFLAVLPLLRAEQCRFLDLPGIPVVAREAMRPEPFKALLDAALVTFDEAALVNLRQCFSPELVLPEALTLRPNRKNTGAGPTPGILDVDQEHVLKVDLNLDPGGQTLSRAFNVRLVTGGAGSGKSLVILYRLRLLRQLYAGKPRRMIVLTHNQPLVRDMEQHYHHLNDGDTGVEWWCFLSWCREHWPGDIPFNPISLADRSAIAEALINEHLPGSSISPGMLLSEIDWCKDSLFTTCEEYLEADRSGRAFDLRERTREKVHAAIEGYQQELRKAGRIDWSEVPRTLWREVQNGKVEVPVYDAIFVDGAQFFAPFWFQILQHCLKETTGHLFIAADPTQGFLKRGQTWIGLGLDVRGRSHRLETSYRSSRAMLNLANLLYRHRAADDPEAPLPPELSHLGVMPTVIPIATAQHETTRVIEEIEALLARGLAQEQLLLIMADSFGVQPMLDRLENQLGKDAAYDPQRRPDGKGIRVCSLEASANLESPIVFLCGAHQLYEREQGLRLSEDEHVALVHGHTRSLYRALSCAGQGLIILHVGELPGISSPDWDIKRSD